MRGKRGRKGKGSGSASSSSSSSCSSSERSDLTGNGMKELMEFWEDLTTAFTEARRGRVKRRSNSQRIREGSG